MKTIGKKKEIKMRKAIYILTFFGVLAKVKLKMKNQTTAMPYQLDFL